MVLPEINPEDMPDLADQRHHHESLSQETVWEGRIVSVVEEQVNLPQTDTSVVRQWVKHPGAVAVVALRGETGQEEILLERQYRHPVRANLWEIPAGLLDIDGEDYLSAAQRELAEETDLRAKEWYVLVDYFNSPGGCNESLRVYLAKDLEDTGEVFERTDEEIDMVAAWIRLEDAVERVLAGYFHNPSTVTGVLAAWASRERGWKDLRPSDAPWFR